jgi:hypothetical protein
MTPNGTRKTTFGLVFISLSNLLLHLHNNKKGKTVTIRMMIGLVISGLSTLKELNQLQLHMIQSGTRKTLSGKVFISQSNEHLPLPNKHRRMSWMMF